MRNFACDFVALVNWFPIMNLPPGESVLATMVRFSSTNDAVNMLEPVMRPERPHRLADRAFVGVGDLRRDRDGFHGWK